MLHAAERLGRAQFATMQDHYNLVYREVNPLYRDGRTSGLTSRRSLPEGGHVARVPKRRPIRQQSSHIGKPTASTG